MSCRKKILAALRFVIADFKTVEQKFIEQGVDANEVKRYLQDFKALRDGQKIKDTEEKNIDYWGKKSFEDFIIFVDGLKELSTEIRQLRQKKIAGAKIVAENEGWYIFSITTYEASKFLAEGTGWCIKHENHWKSYSENSDFYFYISKNRADKWKKIALQFTKEGKKYWDDTDNSHNSLPAGLNVPQFNPVYIPRIKVGDKLARIDMVDRIPDGTSFHILQLKSLPNLKSLPENLSVSILDFGGTSFEKLPKGLDVESQLILTNSNIVDLPDDFSISGELILKGSKVTKLPKNLNVNDLDLSETLIEELSQGLHVEGDLILNSHIKNIPSDIKCEYLDLTACADIKLPPDVFSCSQIKGLPKTITKLPRSLSVYILDLTDTNIRELPEKLRVADRLVLNDKIKKLPSTLEVDELKIPSDSSIQELPDDLSAAELDISGTKIAKLPSKNVNYNLLNIKNTPIESLPDRLSVKKLDMRNTLIEKLPSGFWVGSGYLNDKITEIPDDAYIEKHIYVKENQLQKYPERFKDSIVEVY